MVMEDKTWVKDFSKCPGCGSEERYFEGIVKDMVARKLLPDNIKYFDFQRQQGIPLPQEKIATLPVGFELPGFDRIEDTCCGCGTVYVVHLGKPIAKKSLPTPRLRQAGLAPVQLIPNREQRRMGIPGVRGFQLPPLNLS